MRHFTFLSPQVDSFAFTASPFRSAVTCVPLSFSFFLLLLKETKFTLYSCLLPIVFRFGRQENCLFLSLHLHRLLFLLLLLLLFPSYLSFPAQTQFDRCSPLIRYVLCHYFPSIALSASAFPSHLTSGLSLSPRLTQVVSLTALDLKSG